MVIKISKPKTGLELSDHILFDHDREVPNASVRELKASHNEMHRVNDHWNHRH